MAARRRDRATALVSIGASMDKISSDIAFTPSVKAVQAQRGSRATYEKVELRGGFRTEVTDELAGFLAEVDTAFLATTNAEGQPYAQHRGGPKGFIKALDTNTLAFADYRGNRQYISVGNLADNDRAFLFLMDYAHRRRVKVWGRARIVDDDPALIARLMPEGYAAKPEHAVVFTVEAWDVNCPQHIPQKVDLSDVHAVVTALEARIAALEAENATLRQATTPA
jgi:predicted pyridoxine 5'-phosphate oxidase superfamily flavin-nucleotide-binding protein